MDAMVCKNKMTKQANFRESSAGEDSSARKSRARETSSTRATRVRSTCIQFNVFYVLRRF